MYFNKYNIIIKIIHIVYKYTYIDKNSKHYVEESVG